MYFKIVHNIDLKISGSTYPQTECLSLSHAHSIKFDEFANPDNLKLEFILVSKAKLTDVLSQAAISANGLLINQKVKDILDTCNIMQHRYYPVLLHIKNTTIQYYWLHLVDNNSINFIDYSNSKFYWTRSSCKQEMIAINSFEHYIDLKKEKGILWGVEAETIKLKEIPNSIDIISCLFFDMNIYISQKIHFAFIEKKIIGVKSQKAENIHL